MKLKPQVLSNPLIAALGGLLFGFGKGALLEQIQRRLGIE